MSSSSTRVWRVGAIIDAAGCFARPGALAVRHERILAAGAVDFVLQQAGPSHERIDLPDRLLMPMLVNAHVHLDLSGLGPRPYGGDFTQWASEVMAARQAGHCGADAVRQGAAMSLQSGVGWVGDIAGSAEAALALASTGLSGVSYLEGFGQGARQVAAMQKWRDQAPVLAQAIAHESAGRLRLGLQPHAPYSAGYELYDAAAALAAQLDLPLCTHLAETLEEIEFVRSASGPWAERLRQWGKWDERIVPRDCHPVDYLAAVLRRRPWLLAHCNYLDRSHIALLAAADASVVYCPVASAYFGHRDHPYRQLLAAGVNVCLGVDSVLCQDPDEPQPLGIAAQMRYLLQRDEVDEPMLLAMATVNGLKALGLDPSLATFMPGVPARIAAVQINPDDGQHPLRQALMGRYPVEALNDSA